MSKITPKHYALALYELVAAVSLAERSKLVDKFLKRVYYSGHLRWLPEIIRAVEEFDYIKRQVTPVKVSTNREFSSDFIHEQLIQLFPQEKIEINQHVDTKLIGGMMVESRDQRWNLSLRGQLDNLAYSLKR